MKHYVIPKGTAIWKAKISLPKDKERNEKGHWDIIIAGACDRAVEDWRFDEAQIFTGKLPEIHVGYSEATDPAIVIVLPIAAISNETNAFVVAKMNVRRDAVME